MSRKGDTSMSKVKILAISGSTRQSSFNTKLIEAAAREAESLGAEVSVLSLRDYPMPFYDGDVEQADGLPEKAVELKRELQSADALLLASPEYNASISAVLKNAIDWTSRPGAVEGSVYASKTAALLSASPGALGGLRGLSHVRAVLMNLGVLVITKQQAVSQAYQAFDENGSLRDQGTQERLRALLEDLIQTTGRLKG